MVPFTDKIVSSSGKTFFLTENLISADYGVNVATCKLCSEQYVEQLINKFFETSTTDRNHESLNTQQQNGNAAPLFHCSNYHHDHTNVQLLDCCEITYVFKPYDTGISDVFES